MASPINLSIKALSSLSSVSVAPSVSVRSLGTIPSSTYYIASASSSNHRYNNNSNSHQYHQIRHFARPTRPRRPSNKRFSRKSPTNNIDKGSSSDHNNDNNGILTNNPPPPKYSKKNVLIIGSQGELGKTLVSHFGNQLNWNVVGADVLDPSDDVVVTTKGLKEYISLPSDGSVADLSVALYRGISNYLSPNNTNKQASLDAIVCASGGWMGDVDKYTYQQSVTDTELLEDIDPEEEYIRDSSDVCERMMRVNYYPIVAGGMIGQRFLHGGTGGGGGGAPNNNNGLFVIIGASAALSPTPGMMGYGAAKAASHHYLQSYGPSILEENGSTSVGILPLMLDTPANRAMLGGDGDDDRYSKMVNPIHIANEIGEWIKNPHLRPHSGSLVKVIAKNRMDGSGGAAFHLVR